MKKITLSRQSQYCTRISQFPKTTSSLVIATGLSLVGVLQIEAADLYWTGATNDSRWNEAQAPSGGATITNWSNNGQPSSNDVTIFQAAQMTNNVHNIDLNGNRTVRALKLRAGQSGQAFTFGDVGDKLTVRRDTGSFPQVSLTSSGANHVINANVGLADTSSADQCVFSNDSTLFTINGVISGSDGILIDGSGTTLFTGANTYTGGTTVANTTLRVANASGSATGTGAVEITSSTLEGNGSISGATTIESSGTVAPGAGAGSMQTLNFGGNLTVDGTYLCEINGGSTDLIAVTGVLDVSSATLDVSELGTLTADSYTIATCSNTPVAFNSVTGLTSSYVVQYNAGSITLVKTPIYVDADAPNGGDGLSWGTAFNKLQDGLAKANNTDEVWVADGVYYVDEGASQTNGNRSARFELEGGVSIYGGFNGSETALSQRDPSTNITVLSGDLDKDDTTNGDGVVESADDIAGTNAYKVVNVEYSATTAFSETRVDGVTITGGKADGSTGDRLTSRGGGLLVESSGAGNLPIFENCRFVGNYAYQGGGVCVGTWAYADFVNCEIRGNRSANIGGGLFFWRSSVNLTQCSISGNIAGADGGGIHDYMSGSGHTTNYTNCTITGNISATNGGGYATNLPANNTLENVLIWNNQDQSGQASTNSTAMSLSNCLFEDVDLTGVGTANINGTLSTSDPKFIEEIDLALMTKPTAGGDHRLKKGSGAADQGDNSFISLAKDLYGDPRIENGTVDIGAYELDVTAPVFTLLGPGIQTLEVDDTANYVDPGFTAVDDRDGDIAASTTVITQVNMGVAGFGSVTYIGSDVAGNVFSSGRTVSLLDTTKPTITAPADLPNVEITSPLGMAISLGAPTLTDNASADPTPSNNAPSLFQLGTTNVTWTAQDASGNTSDPDVQQVTVVDTTAPVITTSLPLADINVEYTGSPATVSLTAPTATDNGDASPKVAHNAPATFPLGTTIVRWTVTDTSGNSTTADQNVIVADTIAPTITAPANVVGLEGNTSITDPSNAFNKIGGYTGAVLGSPTNVTDAVDSSVTVTNDAPSIFPLGITTVTWRAEDDAGNFTEVTQTVEVVDTVAPVLTLEGEEILQFDEGSNFTVPSVTVAEVCDTDLLVSATPFLNAGSDAGTYVVAYNATDESGNAATPVYRAVIVGNPSSSVYCVDDVSDFTVTTDRGATGLSVGDTVTWNAPSGAVTDLIWGWNAHTNLIAALGRVPDGGTVRIGAGTFVAGQEVRFEQNVTVTGSGADLTMLSGDGAYRVLYVPWSSPNSYDVTLEKFSVINSGGNQSGKALNVNSNGQTRVNEVRFTGHDLDDDSVVTLYADVVLTNCEISGSVTTSSLLNLYSDASPTVYPVLVNCTIAGNRCDSFGLNKNGTNTVRFDNCVIFGNEIEDDFELPVNVVFRSSVVEGVTPTEFTAVNAASAGNLDGTLTANNPLFVKLNSTLPSTTHDLRIASNSPLVDQGDSALNPSSEDLLGNARVTGSGIDIGAHEVVDTTVLGGSETIVYTDASGIGTFELNDLAADFIGSPTSYALASNSNTDLVSVSLVGSKVNVTLDQVGFASLRFSATNGSSTGVHTIHFGVSASPVYVDANATGAGTGLNWTDAFTNLNDALLAQFPGTALDVWIADGKYFPDEGKTQQQGDTLATFELKEGVRLYGGFVGGETALSQRDPNTNLSIISGDIDDNDVDANGDGVVDDHSGISGENSNILMYCHGVSSATVVDGLVFTGAHGRAHRYYQGPCIYAELSSLQLHNCLFQGNHGTSEGGVLYFDGDTSVPHTTYTPWISRSRFIGNRGDDYAGILVEDCALTLDYCEFYNNKGYYGGILYASTSTVHLNFCKIQGNHSHDQSAVLYLDDGDVTFNNCLITGNHSSYDAPVVYMSGGSSDPATTTFRSCTIAGNYCSSTQSDTSVFRAGANDSIVFEDSIVWGNAHVLGDTKALLFEAPSVLEMRNSLVQFYTDTEADSVSANSSDNLDGSTNSNRPRFITPIAANTAPFTTGDYQVNDGRSSILNKGLIDANTPTLDLIGNPRVIKAGLDLGCYESTFSGFDVYIARYYPLETNAQRVNQTTDASGNGLANMLAFYLNLDPRESNPQNDVVEMVVSDTEMVFEFPRRDDATYLDINIETSTNLIDFVPAVHGENGVVIEVVDDGFGIASDGVGVDKVKVTIPKAGRSELFGRLSN